MGLPEGPSGQLAMCPSILLNLLSPLGLVSKKAGRGCEEEGREQGLLKSREAASVKTGDASQLKN